MDIHYLGHSAFELQPTAGLRADRPVPDGQPEGGRRRRRARRRRDPASPTVTSTTSATPSRSPLAPDATSWRSWSSPTSSPSDGVERRARPEPRRHRLVRLGLRCKLVPAWHTSTTPKGTVNTPAGLIVAVRGKTVYHLGDTALFSDLRLHRPPRRRSTSR